MHADRPATVRPGPRPRRGALALHGRRMRGAALLNDRLERLTGRRLLRPVAPPAPVPKPVVRPPQHPADRLVPSPVFLLSSVRSGSTLLRAILDTHSQVHAPIELHVRRIEVALTTPPLEQAMTALDLTRSDLEHLLWDRLLHRQLQASGKRILVEKTPSNVFVADRLATCWPAARFVHLLRHPLSAARSWHEGDPARRPMAEAVRHVAWYARAVERERVKHPGLTVRYEDLVADPATASAHVCDFLGVPWEAAMLDYGGGREAEFVKGIGDWTEKIRSGRVQAGRPLPDRSEVPAELLPVAKAWGYA